MAQNLRTQKERTASPFLRDRVFSGTFIISTNVLNVDVLPNSIEKMAKNVLLFLLGNFWTVDDLVHPANPNYRCAS